MGGFANSALNFLLGWMRGAAQWLWQLINSPESGSALDWLGQHWLSVTIVLCIAGIIIDLLVYLARWRPDLVWRSFFRRVSRSRMLKQAQEPMMPIVQQADEPTHVPVQSDDELTPALQAQLQQSPAAAPPRRRRSERHEKPTLQNRLARMKELLLPEDQEVTFQSYKPTKPVQAPEATAGKPYIPPQWQKPED